MDDDNRFRLTMAKEWAALFAILQVLFFILAIGLAVTAAFAENKPNVLGFAAFALALSFYFAWVWNSAGESE